MARIEKGPFGEPIFPESEPDLELEPMIRYRTKAEFETIAEFYEEQLGGRRDVVLMRSEHEGHPVLTVGSGPKATDVAFSSIVVMVDASTLKKRRQRWHILVTSK